MTRLVLDASAALPWCFRDEETKYTRDLQAVAVDAEILVPPIWPLEIVNALVMAERRKRVSRADVDDFLDSIEALDLVVEDTRPARGFREALLLARQHEEFRLTAYDAAYLGLAKRRGLRQATLDGALIRAAKAAGVEIFQPNESTGRELDSPERHGRD